MDINGCWRRMRIKYLTILTLSTAPSPSVGLSVCSASTGTRRCARRWSPTGSPATWSPSLRTSSPSQSTRSHCPAWVLVKTFTLRGCLGEDGKKAFRGRGRGNSDNKVIWEDFCLLISSIDVLMFWQIPTLLGSVTPSLMFADGSFMKRLCTASVSSPVACTDSLAVKKRNFREIPCSHWKYVLVVVMNQSEREVLES